VPAEFTDEQEALRKLVRDFAEGEIAPHAERWDAEHTFPTEVVRHMGDLGLFGIPFNPANIMTLPLVIGIGVTNGIHILNRFAEELHPSILARSTGKAVLVSGLTTIAGFGSLIVARHQGIQSLGWVMATGTATCMFVGLTFLPAILNLLDKHGWSIIKTQRDNAQSTLGREEPRFSPQVGSQVNRGH